MIIMLNLLKMGVVESSLGLQTSSIGPNNNYYT